MAYLTGQQLTQADIAALFASGTYTPTLGNMVIGTGGTPTNTAKWTFVGFPAGGVLTVEGTIKFGTTGVTLPGASDEQITLPAGYSLIDTGTVPMMNALVSYYDITGGLVFGGGLVRVTATVVALRVNTVSGSFIQVNTGPTATTPFTWAINDEIHYRYVARCTGP